MTTAFITHADCLKHDMGAHHPECPARLSAIEDQMITSGIGQYLSRYEAPEATVAQIARVHSVEYVRAIRQAAPASGTVHLDPDTAMNPYSLTAALHAAGAGVLATDLVIRGEVENAFCSVRPPGHHATRTRPMGFCIFNNVAIAARHAIRAHGIEKVAIIDFDVHHGNGTQAIFEHDRRVLFAGSHQLPLYPGTGNRDEVGDGNIVNAPLPPGAGSAEFRAAWLQRLLPAVDAFRPQLLMISAGFDAHRRDPLAQLQLDAADFAWITTELVALAKRHCGGRIVSTLEGGYDLTALAESSVAHVGALLA